MKTFVNAATAIAIAVSAPSALAPAASADSLDRLIAFQRIAPGAPNCFRHPDFPVIGRVSGVIGGYTGSSRFSHTGCFPDVRSCAAWIRNAKNTLDPPYYLEDCDPRY